jgi:hypothetical protein
MVSDQKTLLNSEYATPTEQGCVSLWYFGHVESASKLNIYKNDTSSGLVLIGQNSNYSGNWQKLEIDVSNPVEFQFILEGVIGIDYDSSSGGLAIDEISYKKASCAEADVTSTARPLTTAYPTSQVDCNFECNCTCGWRWDNTSFFEWKVHKGSTDSIFTGPQADHTTDSANGYFIYIETSPPRASDDFARLISSALDIDQNGACFKFFYHMFGSDVYQLHIRTRQNGQLSKPVWQKEGDKGNNWLLGQVFVKDLNSVEFVLEGVVGKGFRGDIAIDDISLNYGSCPTINTCDFEAVDICGYVNDVNADFEWAREQGSQENMLDHTYETKQGHFMSALIRSSNQQVNSARLLSVIYPSATLCIKFWYKTSNSTTLNIRTFAFGRLYEEIFFTFRGNSGDEWSLGQATVTHPYAFQFVFEAMIFRPGFDDFLHIDDVDVSFKTCPAPASCDFENGLCGYVNVGPARGADFDWVVIPGGLSAIQDIWIVPNVDHTTNSPQGSFLYLDTQEHTENQVALIESEALVGSSDFQCVRLYLYWNGSNPAAVEMIRRNRLTRAQDALFAVNGSETNISDLWQFYEIPIPPYMNQPGTPFSLLFQGTVGNTRGAVAIDDINYYDGQCRGPPMGSFDCKNGQLVSSDKVCDFVLDCANGFDEEMCGDCDFENGLCGWTDKSLGMYKWVQKANVTGSKPYNDHTLGNSSGRLIIHLTLCFE